MKRLGARVAGGEDGLVAGGENGWVAGGDAWERWARGKKEAQIEIQAVAKIQYPIKSRNKYIKLDSTFIKAGNSRFGVAGCGG